MSLRRIELVCRTADLIASDRRAAGREVGHIGTLRRECEAAMRDFAEALKRINRLIDAYTK